MPLDWSHGSVCADNPRAHVHKHTDKTTLFFNNNTYRELTVIEIHSTHQQPDLTPFQDARVNQHHLALQLKPLWRFQSKTRSD